MKNQDWYVAVTTAPRPEITLPACIESLRDAGWEPTVFAEPGSEPCDAETVWNDTQKGVWHNWLSSARYALDNSNASVIMTVQDDSFFHPDSRKFTESILWPSKYTGFISLYTPKHYSITIGGCLRPRGVNRVTTGYLWGACALVWPRSVLEKAVSSKIAKTWLGVPPKENTRQSLANRAANPHTIANSDTAIGRIVNRLDRSMWFVDPSPVFHFAEKSSIPGHGDNTDKRNCYRVADPNIPLMDQVPIGKRCNLAD